MSIDLFQPFMIGNLELRNRFVRSATWDGSADESGAVTDRSVALYENLAQGEIGLIVTGHAFVSRLGQATPGQYGIYSDEMIPGLRRLANVVHKHGGKVAVQIAHAGINSGYLQARNTPAMAVSSAPEAPRAHREMTADEIEGVKADFSNAARRALEAGFDAVQLHGAHGYLMSQFLSPITNRRQDGWGGTPENRRRFHIEAVRQIRRVVGVDFPVFIKFGVKDDEEGGLQLHDGLAAAQQMVEAGLDAIEVSGGVGMSPVSKGEAYFRDRAAAVKQAVAVPVIAVAGIRSLETANSIVDRGEADLISMCRPFIREPGLIARWKAAHQDPAKCVSCSRCFVFPRRGLPLQCGQDHKPPRE
jgi:2,4-dienoyl-CoA reductase-like NADH-dependent reductase (Old Yellow Enzyme family)